MLLLEPPKQDFGYSNKRIRGTCVCAECGARLLLEHERVFCESKRGLHGSFVTVETWDAQQYKIKLISKLNPDNRIIYNNHVTQLKEETTLALFG